MKNKLYVCVAAILFPAGLMAANPRFFIDGGLGFNKSGVDYKTQIAEDSFETQILNRAAFSGGVDFPIDEEGSMYMSLGAGYRQCGVEFVQTLNDTQVNYYELKNDYLQLIPAFKYRYSRGFFAPFTRVSLPLGLLLSGDFEDTDISDDLSTLDIGLDIGLGVEFKASQFASIYLEFGYMMGLLNIDTRNQFYDKLNNAGFTLKIGLIR